MNVITTEYLNKEFEKGIDAIERMYNVRDIVHDVCSFKIQIDMNDGTIYPSTYDNENWIEEHHGTTIYDTSMRGMSERDCSLHAIKFSFTKAFNFHAKKLNDKWRDVE